MALFTKMTVIFSPRFAACTVACALLLTTGWAHPVALVVGFTVLPCDLIARGLARLEAAGSLEGAGPYRLQAAIAACHARAPAWEATDWAAIAARYAVLLARIERLGRRAKRG